MTLKSIIEAMSIAHSKDLSLFGDADTSENSGYPLTPGIQLSSAYHFQSIQSLMGYHENKYAGQRYCRDSNDNSLRIEKYFEVVYPTKKSLLFSSGMSAVSAVLDLLTDNDVTLFYPIESYRKTRNYVHYLQKKMMFRLKFYEESEEISNQFLENEKTIIFIESPSNPHLRVVDYQKIITLKKASPNIKIIIDMTFAGLFNFNIDNEMIDVIIHSCTKYINGHNDVIAGIAIVREELFAPLWDHRSMGGGLLDAMSGFLLLRSLRTYDMRIEHQLKNTGEILRFLEGHPSVEQIYYPGQYSNSHQSEIFYKYHSHGGAVISFITKMPVNKLIEQFSNFKCIKNAPSFGSIDTLIEIPSVMSHYGKSDEFLQEIGLEKGLIRLSVGCEPLLIILNDLEHLLCQ